jgi:hypothetical protein
MPAFSDDRCKFGHNRIMGNATRAFRLVILSALGFATPFVLGCDDCSQRGGSWGEDIDREITVDAAAFDGGTLDAAVNGPGQVYLDDETCDALCGSEVTRCILRVEQGGTDADASVAGVYAECLKKVCVIPL